MNEQATESDGAEHRPQRGPGRTRAMVTALLTVTVLVLAACSSNVGSSAFTTTRGPSPGGYDTITIRNFAFSPSTLTVAPGATVTVTNTDQVAHTVTDPKGAFSTGDIPAGQSKTFTAPNTAGSYPYICSIHQYMSGTLTVSG